MIRYYFKLGLRNILRQKAYSFINIFGLAIGICLFLLISLYVHNEYSYDKFNKKANRIYRMEIGGWCQIQPGIAHILEGQIPEVDKYFRYFNLADKLLTFNPANNIALSKSINLRNTGVIDTTFFDFFDTKLLSGDPESVFSDPMSIVLTKETANKLFGDTDPLNKVLSVDNRINVKVTGIIDNSENFHLDYEALIPSTLLAKIFGEEALTTLSSSNFLTYLLFNGDQDKLVVRNKAYNFLRQYRVGNSTFFTENSTEEEIELRPLKDIYFFKDAKFENGVKHGNKPIVNSFIIIALFILLIAGINFINLTTARASLRAKEVGIKKVVGSTKGKLIAQFLIEAIMISVVSVTIALTLLQISIVEFNNLALSDLNLHIFYSAKGILGLIGMAVLIGTVSGLYPAFYLTHFNASSALKGEINRSKTAGTFRKFLIVFQFIIAAILITGALTVNKQISFMKNKDLGFKKENIVNIMLKGDLNKSSEEIKEKLLQNPNILGTSFSFGIPGNTKNTMGFPWKEESLQMTISSADPDFLDVMDIKLTAGRNFSWKQQTDRRNSCMINETAAALIGWDNPVGKTVNRTNISWDYMMNKSFTIIGVFEDYHLESLHVPVVPMAISWDDRTHNYLSIRISSENISETMDYIETTWNKFLPNFPFEYSFLDQAFDQMYKSEERMQKIAVYFSILAIFIACLGLFGLSAFMTERRTKEIGIRKVLGSSITQIIIKLSKEFSILVLIANLIAIPIGYYLMDKWLQDYPYRIDVQWWVFFAALFIIMFIALVTVSFHSLKAAKGNPVDAIRHE